MKKEIKKLNGILKFYGYSTEKRTVLKVYLSIVLLGKKIPETAKYFGLSENKVQSLLTVCALKLQKSKKFMAQMHYVSIAYLSEPALNLVR